MPFIDHYKNNTLLFIILAATMNFDLDDPLGDLLSDDGSNDSFFESGHKKAATSIKSKNTSEAPKVTGSGATMENLFGITKEPKSTQPAQPSAITSSGPSSLLGTAAAKKLDDPPKRIDQPVKAFSSPATIKTVTQSKKEITFEDDGDLSLDLGFDPKKMKGSIAKKNILDDLLGVNEPKQSAKPRTPPTRNQPPGTPSSARLSRQSTFDKPDNVSGRGGSSGGTGYVASAAGRARPLSKRESSSSLNDPLGLFPSNPEPLPPKMESKAAKKPNETADWLGLGGDAVPKLAEPLQEPPNIPAPIVQLHTQPLPAAVSSTLPLPLQTSLPIQQFAEQLRPNLSQSAQILTATNFETESALNALKHQETQMMLATQMKSQELALMDMQKRQQQLLHQQESNFNELLQKQLHRQSALEMDIKRQTERINSHIQILMAQPIGGGADAHEMAANDDGPPKVGSNSVAESTINGYRMNEIDLRAEIKTLELEKLRLEDLVHNMKTNHDQELDLLEQSYKYVWCREFAL